MRLQIYPMSETLHQLRSDDGATRLGVSSMQDEEKTKDQLINELRRRIDDLEAFEAERKANEKTKDQLIDEQRQRISELEAFEAERKAIATELKGTRQRLQYLLAVSPAIIYSTKASGDYACTFVTENLRAIMGYTPEEMTTDPKGWPDHLHPDDASRVFDEMLPIIERGEGISRTAFGIMTATTSGSRTPSKSSMTMRAIRWSLSGPGPTSPSEKRQSRLLLRRSVT